MAKSSGQITKIYQLKTLGYADISKQLDNVAQKFEKIKKAKLSAQGNISLAKDAADAGKYSEELSKLIVKEQELRIEHQQLVNDMKAINLQRKIDLETQKQRIQLNQAEAGSITLIRKDIRELNALLVNKNQKGTSTIDFRGEILTIDQATAKLKELISVEQEFRRQFQKDGTLVGEYTTGIIQAFKQIGLDDLVGGQITKTKDRLTELNSDFNKLQEELKETRAAGQATDVIEKQMIDNRNEVIKLDTELARLKNDLRGTGDIGVQITDSINNGFKNVKGQVGQFALQYIGLQALFSKVTQGIENTKLISDQTTDLEIQLKNNANAADDLTDSLKELDTRTTVAGLQQIADVALRAGTTSENILSVTEAIDKTKIAFGKDFGSIEEGTETFVKLINIFFEDGEITGDRILKIGNAVRTLANESVASVPFLNDFAGRMAGVRQISNITLPQILGLGAGFEEFKQSAEVSSTVLVKLIPQMAADVEKFAAIAGMTNDTFKQLLTDNPAEALLRVSEGFTKGKGDVEEFAKTLEASGIEAGRAITIIGTLGGKADIFRQRIDRANTSITETGNVTDAFNKKNTNLAATIDKINKSFADIAASRGFQIAVAGVAGVITLIIGNLPILLTLLGLLGVAWTAQNVALVALRLQLIGYNLVIGASYVALGVLQVAQLAYNAVLAVSTGALNLASRAMAFFGITVKATSGPLGIILTIVGLLAAAYAAFGRGLETANAKLSDKIARTKAFIEVSRKAADSIAQETGELNKWYKVAINTNVAYESRRQAIQELINKYPEYFGNLNAETATVNQLTQAYNRATAAIRQKAFATASAELAADAQKKVNEVASLELIFDNEFANSKGLTRRIKGLNDEQIDLLNSIINKRNTTLRAANGVAVFSEFDFTNIKKSLKELREARELTVDQYDKLAATFNQKLPVVGPQNFVDPQTGKAVEVDIGKIKKRIEDITNQIEPSGDKEIAGAFKGSREELKKLVGERERLQNQLDQLLGKTTKATVSRASRLTGIQKDAFKDIDAIRDKALADEEILFQKQQVKEEDHYRNILSINKKAIDEKLAVLKGANAEERKQISELQLEKINKEQETNKKIFDVLQERLKIKLDNDIKAVEDANRIIQEDPTLSDTARAQAQLDADNAILQLQVQFNTDIDNLEKQLNQQTLTNTKAGADAVRQLKINIFRDQRELAQAALSDIRNAGDKQRSEFDINYEKLRNAILNNDKLTATQRKKALEQLAKQQNFTLISSELAQLTLEFKEIEKQYKQGLATEKAYLDAKAAMDKKANDQTNAGTELSKANIALPSSATSQNLLRERLSSSFGFEEDSEEDQLLGETIAQGFSLATDAMNSFFDAERQRIQQSLAANLERIDLEKEQVLAKANSQAEIASIEKQFAAKKRAEEKKAGEQLKKSKRAEAKLSLATELAGIAAAAATNPANGVTFGASGAIMYAALSALAFGRYFLRVGEINREQFAFGGQPGDVPTRGGKFGGKPHSKGGTPFLFKGSQYEAEVDELSVIRTKNAPKNKRFTVSGTQMEIASAINRIGGGIDFAPGARIFKKMEYGGNLGASLAAPMFQPSNNVVVNQGGVSEEKFDELIETTKQLAEEQSKRIDRLQVLVSERDITTAQSKAVKQAQVGTLG